MPIQRVVKSGDCIASIAEEYGFFPDTIWDDPDNSELKDLRGDPNCLMPGDVVVVMDKRQNELAVDTEVRHTFRKKGVPENLTVCVMTNDGTEEVPKANANYTLTIDGKSRLGLTTDPDGMIDEFMPPRARFAVAVFEDGEEFEFELGELDPLDTVSGVHARLTNLGFSCGQPTEEMTEELSEAISEFQAARDLTVNGQFDDTEFADALEAEHEEAN